MSASCSEKAFTTLGTWALRVRLRFPPTWVHVCRLLASVLLPPLSRSALLPTGVRIVVLLGVRIVTYRLLGIRIVVLFVLRFVAFRRPHCCLPAPSIPVTTRIWIISGTTCCPSYRWHRWCVGCSSAVSFSAQLSCVSASSTTPTRSASFPSPSFPPLPLFCSRNIIGLYGNSL